MKKLMLLLFTLATLNSYSQLDNVRGSEVVTFVAKIDKNLVTSDGIYLQGYVVHMNNEMIEKLNGEKVKISGRVTTFKPSFYGRNTNESKNALKNRITKHILKPEVVVLN